MSDGDKIAIELKKDGWHVEHDTNTGTWTATHPNTRETIRWKRGVRVQRVHDEAAAALGRQVRTTSGVKRKERRQRHRVHARVTEQMVIAARRRAVESLRYRPTSVQVDVVLNYTDTQNALRRAAELGISGEDVQAALVAPLRADRGYNDCTVYTGPKCRVIVDPDGKIVTVQARRNIA